MEILPNGWHFLPKSPGKNIRYYKNILIQEKSVQVDNIMNKKDPSQVLYHKFIIKGFVSCAEWGPHPSLLKTLKETRGLTELQYSYYDYMDAFEKILFYQNQDFDHSWFMMFERSFKGPIPVWFLKWWEMFGLIPQILPEPLQDAFRYFSSKFPLSAHGSQFPAILHMTVMYRIHWISKWNYALNPSLLDREFSIKWWDSFRTCPTGKGCNINKSEKRVPTKAKENDIH
nr:hypothetical protein CFP56_43080 [Quercus suber]